MANPYVELRCETPRTVIDVLDAVSGHRRISRAQLVNEILEQWSDDKLAEMTAIYRVTAVPQSEIGR